MEKSLNSHKSPLSLENTSWYLLILGIRVGSSGSINRSLYLLSSAYTRKWLGYRHIFKEPARHARAAGEGVKAVYTTCLRVKVGRRLEWFLCQR